MTVLVDRQLWDGGPSIEKINELIGQKYITERRHPKLPLRILNYSQRCQWDRHWTPETRACRGLILDDDNNVAERPFGKFFNLGEKQDPIPSEPFEVYEKMDGWLGILYYADPYAIATRGSFTSQGAIDGTRILKEQYGHIHWAVTHTFLFEIIAPSTRIVVDYGGIENLVLLAIIDKQTGKDVPLDSPVCFVDGMGSVSAEQAGVSVVKRYDGIADYVDLTMKDAAEPNREGYVVKFESGLRLKIKFDDYVRLHRLMVGASERRIWEHLRAKEPLFKLTPPGSPERYCQWVERVVCDLEEDFAAIERKAMRDFKVLETRKETAAYFATCSYPHVMFQMLDELDYSDLVWKMVRPVQSRPFMNDVE